MAGMTVIPASALSGAERSHPSLVEPAITKCAVCHTNLGAAHVRGAATDDCLSCHAIVKRSGKTFLIVDDGPESTGMVDLREPEKTGAGDTKHGENEIPAPSDTRAAPSKSPRVETVAVVAGERETPPATDPLLGGATERQGSVVQSGVLAAYDQLYVEGMAAFNRADFDRAFNSWRAMLNEGPDLYALQVEVDSFFESAQSTFARYGEHSLFIIVKDNLYWVYSGLFPTREKAIEALNLLPEPLRQGGAFPVSVREILPLQ